MKSIKLTIILLIFLFSPAITHAATEFISIIDTDGPSGDYSTLSAWEQYNQTDLTSAATQVFSGTRTNTITDNTTLYLCRSGVYQTHTGRLVHATATQALLDTITGAATEQASDIWYTNDTCDSANYFTISDGGDSAISVASCQATTGVADGTAVTIDGWTTSVTNYIKVYTTEANRHDGVWDEGKYRIVVSNANDVVRNDAHYTLFEGIQIESSRSGAAGGWTVITAASEITYVDKCILRWSNATGNSIYGAYFTGDDAHKITNSVIYNSGTAGNGTGIMCYGASNSLLAYNNTVYGCGHGVRKHTGTFTVKNCAVFNNTDDFYGTPDTIDYCASDDGDGTNAVQWTGGATDWANVFTDYANGDFHLKDFSGTGAIIDQGDDLTAEGFTDDIDSDTRTNHSWDIGADEAAEKIYRSVGPSASSYLERGIDGGGNNLNISGSTATFGSDLGTDVGVGDVIQYDDDNDGDIDVNDSVAFIHARASATSFTVKNSLGGAPTATLAADQDWSIFRSYDSLSHAESGDENDAIDNTVETFENWVDGKDIVTSNEQWNIACYNGEGDAADETAVTINDWTTGANNYIKVYTPTEITEVGETQRHSGVWSEGKYRLEVSGDEAIGNREGYLKIKGLQIYSGDFYAYRTYSTGGEERISYNIIRGNSITYREALNLQQSTTFKVWNNIIYDYTGTDSYGIHVNGATATAYIFNNSFIDNTRGIYAEAGETIAINNIVKGSGDTRAYMGTFASGTDYNATDGTDDIGQGTHNRISQTFSFVNETGDDFHLASTDTSAKDTGTDLSSDANLSFSDDIDGDSRPSDVGDWDIGADEAMPPTIIKTSLTSKINSSQTSKMTDGLVLMQSFDGNHMDWNEPAAEARDQSGQANHGDVIGATATIGKIGQGLNFNGTSGYISQGNVSSGIQTIAFWIKADDLTSRKIIDIDGTDQIEIDGTSNILATSFPGATTIYIDGTVSSVLTAGWHHIIITDTTGVNTSAMDIGRVSSDYFDGELDEIRLYTRVLSSDEVGDLHRMGRVVFRK